MGLPPMEPSRGPQYCHWSSKSCSVRSTVSAFGNWVPIKSLRGEGKKSRQKRKCRQSCSPMVALSPDCLSERAARRQVLAVQEFHIGQWKLAGMLLGPAGGSFHFYEMQTHSSVLGWATWRYEFFALSSASGVQFIICRQ